MAFLLYLTCIAIDFIPNHLHDLFVRIGLTPLKFPLPFFYIG